MLLFINSKGNSSNISGWIKLSEMLKVNKTLNELFLTCMFF